ncbi:unnamed protein product [Meganyctiphanes norvegica]|uniref:Uncharacterized protein n=1 Tax=Meganyctiphanes norvegica TaxID=48144 RepID=A0AAV2RFL3_MEGNR
MSSCIAPEQHAPRAVGLDRSKTHKKSRKLVEGMNNPDIEAMSKVPLRSTDKATHVPALGVTEGEIPEWLEGSLYRDGPGILNIGDTWYHHYFDGMAVIHKFNVKNGEARYSSRILESSTLEKNTKANRIVCGEFATVAYPDPCMTTLQKFMSRFEMPDLEDITDNCAVNVGFYGDELFAMTETNHMRRIDPETLQSIGDKSTISKYVAVNLATAHPHVDEDGTVYNMGNSFTGSKGPTYNIIKFPPPKTLPDGKKLNSVEQGSVVASIPCQWKMNPGYYHSFHITDNYFILIEQPLGVSVPKLVVSQLRNKGLFAAMKWHDDVPTKFRVVRRSNGKELKCHYQAETFFTFHQINAYEEAGHLVIDTIAFEDGNIINSLFIKNLSDPEVTRNMAVDGAPRRYVLPLNFKDAQVKTNLVTLNYTKAQAFKLKNGKINLEFEPLTEGRLEMPRINYKFNGKKYRYCYGFETTNGINAGKLVKVDTVTKQKSFWIADTKCISEPIFIERPGATEEDDGVVLASLLHADHEKQVQLLILDAKTFTQLALVTFQTMGVVTKDLHGLFARDCDTVHRY